MIEHFKRWFVADDSGVDFGALSEWSRQFGGHFKRAREGAGFVLDASWSGHPWRLEWGPSQRGYIPGFALDLRMELGLPTDLQMLVMNRPLAESLESLAFEQCTQSMQTVIDCAAPEEMRWLSMFPKVNLSAQKALRARYGAWSSSPSLALWWLEGPLSHGLEELARHWLPEDIPFVLMTLRGNAGLARPDAVGVCPCGRASAANRQPGTRRHQRSSRPGFPPHHPVRRMVQHG